MPRAKFFGLLTAASLVFVSAQSSASVIDITYTGQIFGGTANAVLGTFCGVSCSASGYTFTGQAFTLNYLFDTSAAAAGDYINNGSSSFLTGSFNFLAGTVVGQASGLPSVSGFDPSICSVAGCSSQEFDKASVGTLYTQLISWQSGSTLNASVSTSLFPNAAIPGDITAAFALSGSNIGSGFFGSSGSPGALCGLPETWRCLDGNLQIESVVANGALLTTPLPATFPLFATAIGIIGLLGWRRRKTNA